MTIHLPEDLAGSIRAEVLSGHFASEDDMVAAAVRDYLRRQQQVSPPADRQEPSAPARKPIWQEFEEIAASIPQEVWDKMPADSSEQLDHYLYGTPKRPAR
jgi:Arc/MetJ-type ribon-helix-helix transcriptional regulator